MDQIYKELDKLKARHELLLEIARLSKELVEIAWTNLYTDEAFQATMFHESELKIKLRDKIYQFNDDFSVIVGRKIPWDRSKPQPK